MTCMCADIFPSLGQIQPGGEALNFIANCCGHEHIERYIIGAIGRDAYGDRILASIAGKDIHQEYIHREEGPTANNVTYLTEEGDRYYKSDSWTGGVYQAFQISEKDKELMAQAHLIHTGVTCPNFREILDFKKQHDFLLSVDFDITRDFDQWEDYLEFIDFFFISGDDEVLEIASALSLRFSAIFVVTLAEKGSVAFHKGRKYQTCAVPVSEVVDTTGCGDSYQAGFICEYLRSEDILKSMVKGSETASHTLSFVGGFERS
ncbi:MAG: hypothetical protein IJ409_01655 [Lachnospiraceae bacterium]|nr:hypothetical protein [Lachnospiraceae bacterium]